MATEASQPLKISVEAAADLSTKQYLFVKDNGSGKAVAITAATDVPLGVLQNKPKAAGQMAEIVVVGVTKVVAVGAINPGGQLGSDASGKAQAVTPTGLGGAYVQGTKLCVGQLKELVASAASDVVQATVNVLNPIPAT